MMKAMSAADVRIRIVAEHVTDTGLVKSCTTVVSSLELLTARHPQDLFFTVLQKTLRALGEDVR